MSTRAILISSNAIVDDVWLADGSHQGALPGGAAMWAAIGARYHWPRVAMLVGVGDDFEVVFGSVVDRFDLDRRGHIRRDAHTIRSLLRYHSEDNRSETPAFGADHFQRMQVTTAAASADLLPAVGTYIFRDLWEPFWTDFANRRASLGTVLWELQGDVATAESWPEIQSILPQIDVFSLNLAEAEGLFGDISPLDAINRILSAGVKVCALRQGAEGAILASGSEWIKVSPAKSTVVDVTGGGNAFCGGLLSGLVAHDGRLADAGRAAAVSAAACLAQFGPPIKFDPKAIAELESTVIVTEVAI